MSSQGVIDYLTRQCQQYKARIAELEDKLADMAWDYNEAMRQYDLQQKRACEAEAQLETAHQEAWEQCARELDHWAIEWYQMMPEARSGVTRNLYQERAQHCEYCANQLRALKEGEGA